jgi:transposase, IS30 family
MEYKQITRTERVVISNMMKLKFSYTEIANHLNRNKSSISREVRRNSYLDTNSSSNETNSISNDISSNLLVYDSDYAHKKKKRVRVEINKQQIKLEFESKKYPNLEKYIIEKLKLKWSPEQIAGRMKKKDLKKLDKNRVDLETTVSHETIYKYIYSLAPKELEESTNQESMNQIDNQNDKETYLKQLTLKVELSSNLRHNKGQFNRYRRRHGTRQRAKDRDQLNKKR